MNTARVPGDADNRHASPARHWRRLVAAALFLATAGTTPALHAQTPAMWQAVRAGSHALLLRHALAPGTGDPAHFALRDCTTQRNLSKAGREQAARIGARLRARGIETARVYSSQWCRCLETARLLGLGPVEELPALNSFFRAPARREPQTQALARWLAGADLARPLILVTHQVNITALTGVYPASGEIVLVRRAADGTLSVAGTMATE